ncbi:MAG TPA: FadR/GntR family transcriptional regulator, partial [Candidatus Eisenbacteria bacterium]|nr:FadR/GntR family transcriptional regulator [Candidatus Eisenbacteria bacterium]
MSPEPDSAEPAAVDYLQHVRREDRLADKVADLLKKAVLSGQLGPGDRLPPERVLGERFGVSRTVVREAIRSLTAKGLVEVRSGSGSVVARVSAEAVAETMRLYLQGAALEPRAVEEVRAMLEVHVAGLAAERATEQDLQAMRTALGAMAAAGHESRAVHDAEFHRCVARAARNPLCVLMLDSLAEPVMTARREAPGVQGRPPVSIGEHQRILERIGARDPEGARLAMR